MEYPGTKFTRPVRRFVLILFVAAFFIIAPLVILYATGYRYDWKNGLLRETGGISIDILPKNTTVYLNGLKLQDTMPVRLKNITPQKYSLRLSAPGYYDWQKEIEVKNKQTAYIKEIRLIKKSKPELVTKGKISGLALSSDGRYLVYLTQEKNRATVWLKDSATADATSVISNVPSMADVRITWAPKNNYFAISEPTAPHKYLMIVNADNPDKKTDLAKINGAAIIKFEWRESAEPELYYSTRYSIVSFTPDTARQSVVSTNNYLDWYMENGGLWTLQLSTTTQKIKIVKDTKGFSSELTSINSDDSPLPLTSWRLLTARRDNALLKNRDQNVILARADKKFTFSGEDFLISKFNNWWLISTPWELWTYSEGAEPYLLNRSGEKLQQVLPLDEYNTLALVWENKITVLFPYYFIQHDLVDEKILSAAADADNRLLYYTDETGLWKLAY